MISQEIHFGFGCRLQTSDWAPSRMETQNVSFAISSHAAQRYPHWNTNSKPETQFQRQKWSQSGLTNRSSSSLFCSSLLSAVAAAVSTGTVTVPVSVTEVDPTSDRRWAGVLRLLPLTFNPCFYNTNELNWLLTTYTAVCDSNFDSPLSYECCCVNMMKCEHPLRRSLQCVCV